MIDWLYLSDDTSGALIVFPRNINRWNISASLVSTWYQHKVVVVTDHPNEFTSVLDTYGDWRNKDIIPFTLITFSEMDAIDNMLHHPEVDIILFDDARMLATIASAIDLTNIQTRVLVLTTWGDSLQNLNIITEKLSTLALLIYNDFTTPSIIWQSCKIPMSERQLKYYDEYRIQEADETKTYPYPITRRLTLYTYPDNIITTVINDTKICSLQPSDNTWITSTHLTNIELDGPKLASLLNSIDHRQKNIILTRFNHLFGIDLIASFLELSGYQSYHISCTDDYDQVMNTLYQFEHSSCGILITNIVPFITLTNIYTMHVIDTYAFQTIIMMIDQCHPKIICCHIATHPCERSSDLALYEQLLTQIQQSDMVYQGLISQGLCLNPSRD